MVLPASHLPTRSGLSSARRGFCATILFASLGIMLFVVSGCGEGRAAKDRANSYVAYDAALKAIESRDFAGGRTQLDLAIDAQGLNGDTYIDARIQRAYCLAQLGDTAAARADLDAVKDFAPEDAWNACLAYVLRKEGKRSEAQAAESKARRANRMVKLFKD